MKKIAIFALMFPMAAMADSYSSAGSIAGSTSGAIGYIDNSTRVTEAADVKHRNPGVFAAGVTAGGTNPCIVSVGGGASASGVGINFAQAYNDKECTIRESLRLMAAVATNTPNNHVLMRNIACQSQVYWDAMEMTAQETGDARYGCPNPRPEDDPVVIIRPKGDIGKDVRVRGKSSPSNYNAGAAYDPLG